MFLFGLSSIYITVGYVNYRAFGSLILQDCVISVKLPNFRSEDKKILKQTYPTNENSYHLNNCYVNLPDITHPAVKYEQRDMSGDGSELFTPFPSTFFVHKMPVGRPAGTGRVGHIKPTAGRAGL